MKKKNNNDKKKTSNKTNTVEREYVEDLEHWRQWLTNCPPDHNILLDSTLLPSQRYVQYIQYIHIKTKLNNWLIFQEKYFNLNHESILDLWLSKLARYHYNIQIQAPLHLKTYLLNCLCVQEPTSLADDISAICAIEANY